MRGTNIIGGTQWGLASLAALGVAVCAALTLGATGALAANADTQYEVVATDSPDPGFNSRFAERLSTGDATGDGVTDVFASTFIQDIPASEAGTTENGNDAGRVSMINGATRKVQWKVASPDIQAGANFGFFISGVGDVNRDGKDDIMAGASGHDVGDNVDQGRAYVLSGADGSLIHRLDNPHPQANAGFGSRLGSAGDVVGNSAPDLLLGAPANDIPAGCGNVSATTPLPADCRKNEGEVFVFDGATGEHARTIRLPPEDVVGPPCGGGQADPAASRRPCGSFGGNPQNVGDLTGDGIPDFYIPATRYKGAPSLDGRIYIYDGATSKVLIRIDQPDPDPLAFFGLGDLDRGGPGDLNGDGVPELYGHGFLQDGPNGEPSAGRSWVFDGKESLRAGRGVLLHEHRDPDLGANRAFGWALSRTDYNKDGTPDSYISGLQQSHTKTWIYDGRDGSLLKTLALPQSEIQLPEQGNNGTSLGWSSRAPGDLNGDGEPDYVAGAPYQDVNGVQDQGKVYFFLSKVPDPPTPLASPGSPASPGVGPCVVPGAAGYQFPAKMRLSRARVLREGRRLDVVAPITSRAEGDVAVTFFADGRRDKFDGDVTQTNGPLDVIRINKKITRGQAQLGTGIVLIDYQGDGDTRGQFVRLRAASQRAGLDVERISLQGDRFSARGSVTRRARGVVRFRYSYLDSLGREKVFTARAKIQGDGDWNLKNAQVPTQLARCGGYLSVQFTGYFPRRIRGEQLGYELNAGQTRTP